MSDAVWMARRFSRPPSASLYAAFIIQMLSPAMYRPARAPASDTASWTFAGMRFEKRPRRALARLPHGPQDAGVLACRGTDGKVREEGSWHASGST
jgi:hypothetical protein